LPIDHDAIAGELAEQSILALGLIFQRVQHALELAPNPPHRSVHPIAIIHS
jgi:hypothetical protein